MMNKHTVRYGPSMSLIYCQFLIAHAFSAYLLLYQHFRGLREVWYCHKLFFGLSLLGSVLVVKIEAQDWLTLFLDLCVAVLQVGLFISSFVKNRTLWGDNNKYDNGDLASGMSGR